MSCQEIVLEYLSEQSTGKTFHSLSRLRRDLPRLLKCTYEDFVSTSDKKSRYRFVYDCLMTLSCSILRGNRLYDNVDGNCLVDSEIACWKNFILEVFYVFKLFLPAALYFYSNKKYDENVSAARKLVLHEYGLSIARDYSIDEYKLSHVWLSKTKYLKHIIDYDTLEANHLVNMQKLTREKYTDELSVSVSFDQVEHLANTIYPKYSFLVDNRPFIVCRERVADSKFAKVYKLRFVTPLFGNCRLGRYSFDKHIPLYFCFKKEEDLISLIRIQNLLVKERTYRILTEVPVHRRPRKIKIPITTAENFFHRMSRIECETKTDRVDEHDVKSLQEFVEEKGFSTVYKSKQCKTLAYVKNRVIHMTATFRRPMPRKPFLDWKGKRVARIEKMTRALTMTRYKSKIVNRNTVSFNLNYQGPVGTMQLTLSRLLNENAHLGCHITKRVWVSNVCTTTDTTHAGILNSHTFRRECFQNNNRVTYPMMNFPAVVTMIDDAEKKKANSVIINRTSINTCRIYGEELKSSLDQWCKFVRQCVEIDENLVNIFFQIESQVNELLPRNIVLLIQILYLHKDEWQMSDEDIIQFFTTKVLVSRMIMTSNRSFTTYPLYDKKFLSDAVDNLSIKSLKCTRKHPPTISRVDSNRRYRQTFGDVGAISKTVFRQRGRNSNLIDLILNSKDEFFYSARCQKLLKLLCEKYKHFPSTTASLIFLCEQTTSQFKVDR